MLPDPQQVPKLAGGGVDSTWRSRPGSIAEVRLALGRWEINKAEAQTDLVPGRLAPGNGLSAAWRARLPVPDAAHPARAVASFWRGGLPGCRRRSMKRRRLSRMEWLEWMDGLDGSRQWNGRSECDSMEWNGNGRNRERIKRNGTDGMKTGHGRT